MPPFARAVAVLALLLAPGLPAQQSGRPDIVLVLADDLGWSDLGCYGGELRTPNLDALAQGGLRFTQFYNTGRCCPTRASLLTGQYPHVAGVGHMMEDRGHPGYRGDLSPRTVTIAEVLRQNGYRTAMVGKWHVTRHNQKDGPKDQWPLERGFDVFHGTIHGAGSYFAPVTLTDGNDPAPAGPDDYHYTDALGARAAAIVAAEPRDRPLFLYAAFTAPHWPLHARDADIAAEHGRFAAGWDALREARLQRQTAMGLVDPAWALSPRDRTAPPWTEATHREWQQRRMEVYAAQVAALDRAVGTIVSALQQRGRLADTLFLFLADNGGCAEELGQGVSLSVTTVTRDGRPVRRGNDPAVMPGPEDTYQSYGLPWANLSNTPFRLYKHHVHEGGIATPLVVHWPHGFAGKGELRAQPGHVIDVMATLLDVAGAQYPIEQDGHQVPPPAGTSLLPAFRGEDLPERAIFFEHEGNRAVRRGPWKLVARGERGAWELYDLRTDRTELHDLAGEQPGRVAALAAQWQDWAERSQVLPLGGRAKATFSNERRFVLGPDADLPRDKAPMVAGAAFSVMVRGRLDGDGVLVAQGGGTHGWALYRQEGRLCFAVRRGGALTVVRSDGDVGGEVRLEGGVGRDGVVTFRIGDVEVLRGKLPGLLVEMPQDGLQVGRDGNGAVGRYAAPFPLRGEVAEVVIEVAR